MRILVYGINFAPELTGVGKYTAEMAHWLAGKEHKIRVVTGRPHYPNWSIEPSYRPIGRVYERVGNLDIWRSPLWVPSRPSGLKRLIHAMSFAVLSFPFLIRQIAWRPDVVLVIAPSFFSVPGALIISKISGAKSWLHIQDFELDAAYSLSILGNKKFRETVASVEKWLMCKFSNVSTISGTMLARAISKGIEPKRAVLFPNWINLQEVTPLRRPSVYRHELGIPDDAVVALYCGNMGGKQGLEILSAAARKLAHQKRLYFVFCGNGHQKDALIRSSEGLANVRFMDLQPADRLNELLGMGDIHLLPQKAEADGLVMPSKLIGMLASGRPIIATAGADSELGRTVAQCGITVPAGDESAFAEAILRLSGDATLRNKMGERGREFAEENLCMETILSEFMKRLVSAV